MTSNSFFKYINSNFWSFLLITIIIISFFIFGDFWKFCIDALWVDPIVSQFIGNEWWIISICSLFQLILFIKDYRMYMRIDEKESGNILLGNTDNNKIFPVIYFFKY